MPSRTKATPPVTEEEASVSGKKYTDLSKVQVGAISAVTDQNPFARGQYVVPEGHPLLDAFRQSADHPEAAVKVVGDPPELIKLLRRIAAQEGMSVRTREVPDEGVIFRAVPKITRKRAKKEE